MHEVHVWRLGPLLGRRISVVLHVQASGTRRVHAAMRVRSQVYEHPLARLIERQKTDTAGPCAGGTISGGASHDVG